MLENKKVITVEKNNREMKVFLYWYTGNELIIEKIEFNGKTFDLSINRCGVFYNRANGDYLEVRANIKNDEVERLAEEIRGRKSKQKYDYIGIRISEADKNKFMQYKSECEEIQRQEFEKLDNKRIEDNIQVKISYQSSLGGYYISDEQKETSNILKDVQKKLNENRINNDLFKEFESDVDWGDYSVRYSYHLTMKELLELMKKVDSIIEEKNKKKLEKKKKEEERVQKLFELAKETGESQIIRRWTEPCNDPYEECDIDEVCIMAMPDGSEKKVRNHTW